MKILLSAALLALLSLPASGFAATFQDVSVVDVNCSKKAAANPDGHTRACALQCQTNGFGIFTADHKFLKFDSAGNAKVLQALKNSKEKDHLRVDVSGDEDGDTLKVTSIKLL